MKDFRVCPKCDYGRGFHVSLQEGDDGLSIVLICPDCGQSYAPGWSIDVAGGTVKEGPVYPVREETAAE
jgi:hypothetical protein